MLLRMLSSEGGERHRVRKVKKGDGYDDLSLAA